jgi:vibriolysin
VTKEAAIARFKEADAAATGVRGIEYPEESGYLAIQPRPSGEGADLVWQLEIYSEPVEGAEAGRWFVLVDAGSGEILDAWNGLASLEQATGVGGNPNVTRYWPGMLDVEPMDGQYGMKTSRLETYNMNNGANGGEILDKLFGGNGDLVKGPLDGIGDAAINDAHGFAEETLDMMRDWYGYRSIDDNGMVIVSRVHYGTGFNNAFWDGKRMTYGDGDSSWLYPLSGAIDVVAHEINHGFTEKHSNLIYKWQSGGLNESFSDVAGTLAEFHRLYSAADFDMGEDIIVGGNPARFMCDPRRDGTSLDHISQYEAGVYIVNRQISGTDVHDSSGIGNKAFCLATQRYRVNNGTNTADSVREVGEAWYQANAGYWTASATFEQGCQGTVDAARALGFSSADLVGIKESWADEGIECDAGGLECNADGTCDIDAGENCFGCATDCGSCQIQCSGFDRAKCAVGIGDCSRCIEEPGCGDGVCGGFGIDETDASCPRDCGCSAPGDSCGTVAPFGCWCDADCAESGDCCADVDVCQ